jgi:hypothetical protein
MTDAQTVSVLVVPLVLLLLERQRLLFLLYLIVCGVAAGRPGVMGGMVFWVVMSVVKMAVDFIGVQRLDTLGGDSV